jgi:thymidylate kinase
LKGHDWFREDLNMLEARARGMLGAATLVPDLTIFVDLSPEAAVRELGDKLKGLFTLEDLKKQRAAYLEELGRFRPGVVKLLHAAETADAIFPEAMAAIRGLK